MYIMTHCTDSAAFLAEIAKTIPDMVEFDDEGVALSLKALRTQTIRKGNETLSILSLSDAELTKFKKLTTIKVISSAAKWQDIVTSLSVANKKIYDRVYDRTSIVVEGMDGAIETITPPAIWAGFA